MMLVQRNFMCATANHLPIANPISAPSYLAVYYRTQLNIPASHVGIITSVTPFVSFLVTPLWASLADATRRHKLIIITCVSLSIICMFIIKNLPVLETPPSDPGYYAALLTATVTTAAAAALYSVMGSPSANLLDSLTLKLLGPEKELYGRQRAGSVHPY